MKTFTRHTAIVLGSLLAAGLVAGAAAAGNPHGTPPGRAKNHHTPPGQAKKQYRSTSAAGVKPSSTTRHNTYATAGSNQTKLYGNGKTAGQIAIANGASPDTVLYGPGNSQPHKVAVCSKNGKSHYIDVHALKSHASASCATTTAADRAGTVSLYRLFERFAYANVAFVGAIHEALGTSHASGHGVLGARFTRSKPVSGRVKPTRAVVRKASFTG